MNVLNFYHIGKIIPENAEYIGRENKKYNLKKSKFANPYYVKEDKGSTLKDYRIWLWNEVLELNITKQDILSLKDKDLICYCQDGKCHGNIVKALVLYVVNNEQQFDKKIAEYQKLKKQKNQSAKHFTG